MKELKRWIISFITTILGMTLAILSLLMYNREGMDTMLYIGWAILAVSVLILLSASASYRIGKKRDGFDVLNCGIYGIIRQPVYISLILLILGMILIGQNYLSLVLGAASMVFMHIGMLDSEQLSIAKFGDDYNRYLQIVPRVNFINGVMRRFQGEKENPGKPAEEYENTSNDTNVDSLNAPRF